MRTRARLVLFLILAPVPLSAQTTPAPAPKANSVQAPTTDSKPTPKQPTPTVFQADEADRWMLLGKKPLIFKVDPVTTGSDTLTVGTEEMPPGNRIPTHKHLNEDEVIFVHVVCGEVKHGREAVEKAPSLRPDLIVLGLVIL